MDPMGFEGFQICETLIVAQKVPTYNIYQIQDVLETKTCHGIESSGSQRPFKKEYPGIVDRKSLQGGPPTSYKWSYNPYK